MADRSHLVTKQITITNANGTTFTRNQRVRADTAESREVASRLSATPTLTASRSESPGRKQAIEMANDMIGKMQKSYDLIPKDDPIELSVENLNLHMQGLHSESTYETSYTEASSEKIEEIIDGLAEDYSEEEWETFTDNDGRILLVEELMSRDNKQKALRNSMEAMEEIGFVADTGVEIGGNLDPTEEEAREEAKGLAARLGLSPREFDQNEEALTKFAQNNPGSEVRVFWPEQVPGFMDKWETEEGYFNIEDPILYAADRGYGMNGDCAVQLHGSEVSIKRESVKADEMSIQYDFDSSVMVDGSDAVASGKSSTSSESKRFAQDSDPLF